MNWPEPSIVHQMFAGYSLVDEVGEGFFFGIQNFFRSHAKL
jgi:hypothetical protein